MVITSTRNDFKNWNLACNRKIARTRQKSDGGSAFDQFQPGIAEVRSSGDPLIEFLTFFFFLRPRETNKLLSC